jgi:hypothetical protein
MEETSAKACLHAGRVALTRRPFPLIAGWAVAAGITALFVLAIPQDLSSALQLGGSLGGLALLWAQLDALKALGADASARRRPANVRRDWASAFVPMIVAPLVFRLLTWAMWYAVPLTGALMYALMTFGVADMFTCGRLDLLVSAIVFGAGGFMMTCGFLFAPACAVLDSIGPFEALRRSWRMSGGHRLTILRILSRCFWLPVTLFLSAYVLSVLRTAAFTFRGLPAILWSVALASIVLFFGPWATASMTALMVPLKREEDVFVRRHFERRTSMHLS